jgi:hypothetical protein
MSFPTAPAQASKGSALEFAPTAVSLRLVFDLCCSKDLVSMLLVLNGDSHSESITDLSILLAPAATA